MRTSSVAIRLGLGLRFGVLLTLLSLSFPALADLRHLMPKPQKVEVFEDEVAVPLDGRRIRVVLVDSIPGAYDYPLAGFGNEAYRLTIRSGGILIEAVDSIGVLRARQTLAQLALVDGASNHRPEEPLLPSCIITDWPAFKLRGYMHDVGRSFISFQRLRRELQLMALFKVNVFHFHLTENQAWRFEVQAFPQLTAASAMTRFAGCFYTQEQCRELDSVAHANGIVLIPEIDMPGHSAAFERAMGHGMQTDEGVRELEVILGEVARVSPHAPYIHIGGDEQPITYPRFLERMIARVHELGRRAVIWNPIQGVRITKELGADMTQLWSTAGRAIDGIPCIDCRYNYTNHFDTFADLAGIYRSTIYYAECGSTGVAGEISCPWNDRLLPSEESIIRQNNHWANVLASAERAWRGGGRQYIETGGALLPVEGIELEDFADWEERFLFHKRHTLDGEPIAYVRQSNVRWLVRHERTRQVVEARGAGVYLRHTWGNVIPALFPDTQLGDSATAWTFVYSPRRQRAGALIEFQNYSRSEHDLAPENGQWDRKGSRVWLNGRELLPPRWDNAGRDITNEVTLGNENLTARLPISVQLRKGWNKIVVQLPYVAAKGVRLNKWMFTFVLTTPDGRDALEGITYDPYHTNE